MCEVCLKLATKALKQRQSRSSEVFIVSLNMLYTLLCDFRNKTVVY